MEYKIVLLGRPIAWARAGLSNGRFYDKQKHDKLRLGIEVANQWGDRPLLVGPIEYHATYYFKIPNSRSKQRLNLMGTPMLFDPDRDNLDGFYYDLCKGICYHDDNLIWTGTSKKIWWDEDKVEFSFIGAKH